MLGPDALAWRDRHYGQSSCPQGRRRARENRGNRRNAAVPTPYSLDLNPIEQSFAKLKAHLRKSSERSIPALWDRIGTTLQTFTPEECNNYFTHTGYGPK